MQIFILSPNKDAIFTDEQIKQLGSAGEVVIDTEPKALTQVKGLYSSDEEKILAMDPDFIDWKFPTTEALENIRNLKAICLQTTSFSWLDVDAAAAKGIPVVNLRGFSSEAVAEYVLMMTLSIARKMPLIIKDGYKQDFVKHQGVELKGKTAAVIGLGRIGSRIAELMEGIGMNVVYWSKHEKSTRYRYLELAEIFKSADVVFPTVAQNDETTSLITDEMLKSMKPDAMFVSIAHKVYNHPLLLNLVKSGQLFGYAFEGDNENPSNYEGNVFAVPAVAWATDGSMTANGKMWTEAILNAAKDEFPTRIN